MNTAGTAFEGMSQQDIKDAMKFIADQQRQYTPPTPQHPPNCAALFRSGKICIGTSLSYPSTHVAKTIAVTNADWVWIDAEHVAWSPTTLIECIQVIKHESGGKMIPIVRVPNKHAFEYMAWCLDAGAGGIIIPHIETVDEVKAVINACRFPPQGHRSYPPFTFIPGVTDTTPEGETIFSLANQNIAIIPQIESRLGIENLDEIVKLPGINAFMIGTGDLRLDMGMHPVMPGDEPEFLAALAKASKLSKATGLPLLGVAAGKDMIKERIAQGFKILVCTSDFLTLAFAMMMQLGEARMIAFMAEAEAAEKGEQ